MNPDHRHSRQAPSRGMRGFLTGMVRRRTSLVLVIPLLAIALAAMLVPRGVSAAAPIATGSAAPESTSPPPAGSNWNPASILQVLDQGTGQVAIAHRGVYGPGCPENSLCSIQQTYLDGVEAMELDVKDSAEGTPWLFHENNAGRLIAHNPPFNPFQNANPPVGWDPAINTLTDAELGSSYLLDETGATTSYHPLSLAGAFAAITSSGWNHMVIVIDLKTLADVSQAATLAKAYGLQDSVVLKFSSSLLAANSPAYFNLTDYTQGIAFVPTMYAPDMATIMQSGWSYSYCNGQSTLSMAQCTIDAWVRNLQKVTGYAWLEVGNKMPVASDPTDFLLHSDLGTTGGFQPVPEYPNKTGPGQSYVRSNGTCCASLNDYLTPANQWFPAETQDGRENISNLLGNGMTSVITDDPLTAIKAMTNRNTSLYSTFTPLQEQLTGTWVGTYDCDQGLTGLRLEILAERTTATATFNFYGVPSGAPNVPSGAYTMTGNYSASGIQLYPGSWIHQPPGYNMVELDGGPLTNNGTTLSGTIPFNGCSTFTLNKAS